MPRSKKLKKIAQNTDMNYIDGKFTLGRIFHLAKKSKQSNMEMDFRFLWGWERSWNMFRRD